jgi:hypothetical protein
VEKLAREIPSREGMLGLSQEPALEVAAVLVGEAD